MAHKVVKEVTQPVHGPDGFSVLFGPGDQFPEDHELPPEVPWKLVIAEAPDEPAAKPAVAKPATPDVKAAANEPVKPAAKPPAGKH